MAKKIDDTIYDKRVVNRNINAGLLTKKDLEEFLGDLPDESKNAQYFRIEEEEETESTSLTFSSVESVNS